MLCHILEGNVGGLTLTPGLYKWTTGVNAADDVTIWGSATDSTCAESLSLS